jgi:type VI secretion system protein ImpE
VLRGDWNRALAQLQVTAQLTAAALPMAQAYREAIRAEAFRAEVFAGRRQPSILGTPPAWSGLLLESLREFGHGRVEAAERLRDEALEAAPPTPGRVDGTPFAWIADMDSRIGPMLEAIVDGKYVWVPFEHLAAVKIETPADLRDFVWAGAALRFAQRVAAERGRVQDADIAALRAAGFSDAETVEIVLHVALNVLTNYVNNVAHTDVDFPRVSAHTHA